MTALDRTAIAKQRSNILRKVLVTGITGALGFGLTELILPNGPWSWLTSVFLGSVVFMTQFLMDVERRLDSMEQTQREESSQIHSYFTRISDVSKLSREIEGSGLPQEVIHRLIGGTARITPQVPRLVLELAEEEVTNVAKTLEDLSHGGDVSYEGEDRDWIITLTRLAKNSIDAVSLDSVDVGAEHFLNSHIGRRYLTEQVKAVGREVRVRRIHVLDPNHPDPMALKEVMLEQTRLGIDVRVLTPDRRPLTSKTLVDFIVFDESISYETTPAPVPDLSERNPVIVDTRLVHGSERVNRRRELFAELWDAAEPLSPPAPSTDGR